jgi:uncharacterized protein (TIGR00369 family)
MNNDRQIRLEAIRDRFSNSAFHRVLGLDRDCFDVENGCIRFSMRPELVGNPHFAILHGGMIASIMDMEGGLILALDGAWPVITKVRGGTIDLRVDYLRPGKGKNFIASGVILHRGNKVAVVRSELRNELDELIAAGTGTYLVG